MPSAPCSVNSCYKSIHSKHCFPNPGKDRHRFNKWVSLCGNRRLVAEMTPEKVYKNCRVCALHFMPNDFGPNKILKKGVLPSLNLPGMFLRLFCQLQYYNLAKCGLDIFSKICSLLAPLEGIVEEVSPSKTVIVPTTADSPRSLRLKQRLETQLEKLRARKQVIDKSMSSASTSNVYELKSVPAVSEKIYDVLVTPNTDDTTNETRNLPCSSLQILGTPPSTSESKYIL